MASSVTMPVDESLDKAFKDATTSSSAPRFFVVEIKEEKLVASKTENGSGNVESDYDSLQSIASNLPEGAYILFRKGSNTEWLFITYVPDSVSVKAKMTYASAKSQLKTKLGVQNFLEEVHITNATELNWGVYKGASKPVEARSADEILREKMLKDEEKERKERQTQAASSTGGYHAVAIPLSDSTRTNLSDFKTGNVNYVQLKIENEKVEFVEAKKISAVSELSKLISNTEPRFYLYSFAAQPAPAPNTNVFVYCCPEKSGPKFRMVYSTAKPKVADEIEKQGIALAPKKIELRDPADLTEAFLKDELKSAPKNVADVKTGASTPKPNANLMAGRLKQTDTSNVPEMGGTVKAQNIQTTGAHPIYSLMAGKAGSDGPTVGPGKKKIVIPPKGAW